MRFVENRERLAMEPIYEMGSSSPVAYMRQVSCIYCGRPAYGAWCGDCDPVVDPGVSDDDFEAYRKKILKRMK